LLNEEVLYTLHSLRTLIIEEEYILYRIFNTNGITSSDAEFAEVIDNTKNHRVPDGNVRPSIGEDAYHSKTFDILSATNNRLMFIQSINYFWNAIFYFMDLIKGIENGGTTSILDARLLTLIYCKVEEIIGEFAKMDFVVLINIAEMHLMLLNRL
jgi:hypothetical protein